MKTFSLNQKFYKNDFVFEFFFNFHSNFLFFTKKSLSVKPNMTLNPIQCLLNLSNILPSLL